MKLHRILPFIFILTTFISFAQESVKSHQISMKRSELNALESVIPILKMADSSRHFESLLVRSFDVSMAKTGGTVMKLSVAGNAVGKDLKNLFDAVSTGDKIIFTQIKLVTPGTKTPPEIMENVEVMVQE